MSKELVQQSEDESQGFTPEGFEPMPSLYYDSRDISNVYDYSDERILAMSCEYSKFVLTPDIMPRAKETTRRVLAHLAFEYIERMKERGVM